MNLIQIQEHLKDLPTDVITSYTNGQNPEVPPYMALGELDRRKRMDQRMAEAPTQSVKDKLQAEVAPQGMPQGMPEGIAQLQGMPQGVPEQEPVMAAAGGLMDLPVPDEMFNYAPGGIVAFAGGGEPGEETAGEDEARANMAQMQSMANQSPGGLQSLSGPAIEIIKNAMAGQSSIPMPVNPEDAKAEAIKRDPRLAAILNKIPGESYVALIEKLKAQNEAGKTQFQDSQSRMGLGALGDALIAAGESTRGQKGLGAAFAGFGKSYSASAAEKTKRQQAQQALERQQEIELAKLQSDTDNLQMAYATGNIEKIAKYKQAVADRQAKVEGNKITAAKEGISLGMEETKMKNTAAHYAATAEHQRLTLEEMIKRHADQASIERQRLTVQEANNNRIAAHQKVMEDIARSTKPTAEEQIDLKIRARINSDPRIENLAKKLQMTEIDSDEYYQTLDAIKTISQTYYPAGTKLPEIPRTTKPEPKEEPGFFKGLSDLVSRKNKPESNAAENYANDPYGAEPARAKPEPTPSKPNVMYAVNPTTGQRIMSSDGGQTWAPLGGRR
jgi:hypothetical protein